MCEPLRFDCSNTLKWLMNETWVYENSAVILSPNIAFKHEQSKLSKEWIRVGVKSVKVLKKCFKPPLPRTAPLPPPPPPVVYSTDRSKAVVPVLVLLFVVLWFILQGDVLYVFPCVILFLCFSVLLVLRLPRLGKRELILVLFVRLSICACLDLSVSSSSWSLGRAAVCDCGTPWTFLLPFFKLLYRILIIAFISI